MAKKAIDVRELKEPLSSHLEEVRQGATLDITDQGRTVARCVPAAREIGERLQQPEDTVSISWSGQKLAPTVPRISIKGPKTVAELLLEDRD